MLEKTIAKNRTIITGPTWNPKTPSIYQIEVFNRCNLQCPFCLTGIEKEPSYYHDAAMDMELFKLIVERDLNGSDFIELQMRGEPTLHKNLLQMVELLREKLYVGFSTHGNTLHVERNMQAALACHTLTISIDAGTPETYNKKRVGGRWEVLITNIDLLLRFRGDNTFPIVDLQLIEEDYGDATWEQELEELKSLADSRGWERVHIRTIHNTSLSWSDPSVLVINRELCLNPWLSVSIKNNGDVVPCCMAFRDEPEMTYGNLQYQSLEEIWKGLKVQEFRRVHLASAAHMPRMGHWLPETCRKCYSRSPALLHHQILVNALKSAVAE